MSTHTHAQSAARATGPSADLYFEMRGAGSPVLLIGGTPGDGGQFDELADLLADRHLVVTYDRTGTSRSPAPPGWTSTTVAEQADAAAGLLGSLVSEPATVYGTSNGAAVALELAVRHPSLVDRAVLHEPPLLTVLADPEPVGTMLGTVIGSAMQAGGPRAALDAFLRFAFGDAVVDGWPVELGERMLANADMVFAVELPAFQAYRPDEAALAAARVPIEVAVGHDQQAPFFAEAARWLVAHAGARLVHTPGAHGPQFTCPDRLAASLFPPA